jgi:hypothetical protein
MPGEDIARIVSLPTPAAKPARTGLASLGYEGHGR